MSRPGRDALCNLQGIVPAIARDVTSAGHAELRSLLMVITPVVRVRVADDTLQRAMLRENYVLPGTINLKCPADAVCETGNR